MNVSIYPVFRIFRVCWCSCVCVCVCVEIAKRSNTIKAANKSKTKCYTARIKVPNKRMFSYLCYFLLLLLFLLSVSGVYPFTVLSALLSLSHRTFCITCNIQKQHQNTAQEKQKHSTKTNYTWAHCSHCFQWIFTYNSWFCLVFA